MRMLDTLSGNTVVSALPSLAELQAGGGPPLLGTGQALSGRGLLSRDRTVLKKEILAGGLAGLSAFASLNSAETRAIGFDLQAGQSQAQAQNSSLLAEQQATLGAQQIAQLTQQFGAQRANLQVALSASGISGGATVRASFAQLQEAEESAVSAAQLDARTRVLNARQQEIAARQTAASFKSSARTTRRAAKFGVFGDLADVAIQGIERG